MDIMKWRLPKVAGWMVGFALALAGDAVAQGPAELLIRNGLIVTAEGRRTGDVRIQNGTIVEIGSGLTPADGARVIDASGKMVLPGGIDPHVHLRPVRNADTPDGADDYTSASRSAFAGGVTTIGNFISQEPGVTAEATLSEAMEVAKRQAMADVILHYTASDPTTLNQADVNTLRDRQVTLKIFMVRPAFDQNAAGNVNLIRAAGEAGVLTMLHAEDSAIITTTRERMLAEGRGSLEGQNFSEAGPVVAEEVATRRAVGISEATGAPIYLVHMSSERAMRIAQEARSRGLPVFTEVRFIYLHLTRDRFNQPDGQIYTGAPPLRDKSDQEYLWGAIADGSVDAVNTDHVGYTRAEKMDPENTIVRSRNAANYLQDQMPLLYSEGVRKGRITLERMVEVSSANPARMFGLYPQKGTIAVGSDADIAIWDPDLTHTIRDEDILSNGRFSIFQGWEVTGWPIITIRRGEVVFEGGQVLSQAGSGRLAPRLRWQKP